MKTIITIVIIFAVLICYKMLSDAKRRTIREFVRQIPYLIPRYYV
ncbi:MAG: hypothetical protein PHY31_05785 [Smithellaceae bacterium]|nr:hypothetical protein [Smithellaceae bacterium]